MNKELLIRHIKGETSADEAAQVIRWVDQSPDNEKYYISLLNTYAAQDLYGGAVKGEMPQEELDRLSDEIISFGSDKIGHVNNKNRKIQTLYTISAAASVLLLISLLLNFLQYSNSESTSEITALATPKAKVIQTYYTNSGVKGKIVLPDSSIVWLNSCSKITYPEKFAVNKRVVEFEGEGYFIVTKNPDSPMIVRTPKGMEIKVLGTKFNIKSYVDDSFEEATLFSGKIEVTNRNNVTAGKVARKAEMLPGESFTFGEKTRSVHSFNVDTVKCSAWTRGELLFMQMPLKEVCKMLSRWHGVEITVKDPQLYDYTFTAEFGSESIVQIMELMKFTMPINYHITGNKVVIEKREL